MANPFLKLRLREVVIENPLLFTGVVRRVNVDAFDLARMRRQQTFQRNEIVALDDEIAVQRRLFGERKFFIYLQNVMRNYAMIALNRGFPFELNDWHARIFFALPFCSSRNF